MPELLVGLKGPIFSPAAPAEVKSEGNLAVRELIELGMTRLAQMLRPRPAGVYLDVTQAAPGQYSTGNYRRNLHDVVGDLNGRIDDSGVVYGPWLEGTGSRNATTRFKGYASFRQTSEYLNQQSGPIIDKHVKKAVAKLS